MGCSCLAPWGPPPPELAVGRVQEATRLETLSDYRPHRRCYWPRPDSGAACLRVICPLHPRGPLADAVSPELAVAFREAVDRLAHATRAIIVLAEPEDERGLALLPEHLGWRPSPFVIQPRRTLRVPLGDDDQLLNQMKPKTRYNVRLAFRRGVTTRQASLAELPTFYELLRETAERDGFGIHRIDYFSDLLRAFNEDAALLFAEFEGQPAAAALVVRFGEEAVYLYGASRTELQRHMPAYAVQWAAMQWARARGCRWYDLWGIPESNELPPTRTKTTLTSASDYGVSIASSLASAGIRILTPARGSSFGSLSSFGCGVACGR